MCDEAEAKEGMDGLVGGNPDRPKGWVTLRLENLSRRMGNLERADGERRHRKYRWRLRIQFWAKVMAIWLGLVGAGISIGWALAVLL